MKVNKEKIHEILFNRGVINSIDKGYTDRKYTDTEVLELLDTVLTDYLNTKAALKNLVAKAQLYAKFTKPITNHT